MLIPVISKLMGKAKKLAAPRPGLNFDPSRDRVRAEPLVLIVAPTRELCCQIFDEARRLCYRSMLRPCVAYGGAPLREQSAQLARGCDILIASPGRLIDFMGRPELLSLARVRFTIIDEADEMLHDDWGEEMSKIMGGGGQWHSSRLSVWSADILQMQTLTGTIDISCSQQPSPSA
jgi:ATP-dependent RNA helicase DDX3X